MLIVEDNPVERELYRLRFSEWQLPATLIMAEDGFEGLMLAGRHSPDLIIADLSMPGMDGFKMIRQLYRQAPSPGAIIVVTGLTAEEIEAQGGCRPIFPCIPSPFHSRPCARWSSIICKRNQRSGGGDSP